MHVSTRAVNPVKVVLAALLLSACSSYTPQGDPVIHTPGTSFTVVKNQRYSPADWPEPLYADVYLPDVEGLRPVVLLVHGGGWERRSREDMTRIARKLARQGIVAANISYRFAPAYRFPAQLHDLQQAMHWLHRQAERFRLDTSRMAGMGYSAGAHLVSLLALVADTGGELDSPYGGPRTRLSAVVAGGTPTDLRKFTGGRLVPQFLGGSRREIPEHYALASPVTHIHAEAPPFFLYHGARDKLVPTDHATDMRDALNAQSVAADLYLLPLRGHLTAFLAGGPALNAATAFLVRELIREDLAPGETQSPTP